MRKVAQPVAVITANLHDAGKVDAPGEHADEVHDGGL
jgi:hypothetical protein